MIGQLGFCIVTPPLVLIFLARLAAEKLGWGVWCLLAAIVLGMLIAFCSARDLLRKYLLAEKKDAPPAPGGFNEHK